MRIIAGLMLAFLFCGPAWAQDNPDRAQPLEIVADQTLEWHRNDKRFIARGNAVATQGQTSIAAQTLTAHYTETAQSSMDIRRLVAEGAVNIVAQGNTATGDRAEYDVVRGTAEMTGDNLRLTSPDQTVTARDKFSYDVAAGRLSAHGNAVVTRGTDTLRADSVAAVFMNDATGARKLKELTATGGVVITTPTETVRGQRGVYDAATNIATLHGNVRIERGPNVLEGDSAEVNLNTNVSRMIGGSGEGGRVRGVFFPGSTDSTGATTPAPTPPPPAITPPASAAPFRMTAPEE